MSRLKEVEIFIEKTIRPYLNSHNGDISIVNLKGDTLTVKYTGACSGCPSSDFTTKFMIEDQLAIRFSFIKKVVLSKETDKDLLDMARKILKKEV